MDDGSISRPKTSPDLKGCSQNGEKNVTSSNARVDSWICSWFLSWYVALFPFSIARAKFGQLDAGAGDVWKFTENETGLEIDRSEGLAVASLYAFKSGLFSTGGAEVNGMFAEAIIALS